MDTPRSTRIDAALLALRVVLAAIFIAHGAQKLFVFGIAGTTGAFTHMGIPVPTLAAPVVAAVESAAGVAVLFGVVTRLAALGLALDMLGAIVFVHVKNGFFLPAGAEFALACLGIAIALVIAGGGAWSIDAMIHNRHSRHPHD